MTTDAVVRSYRLRIAPLVLFNNMPRAKRHAIAASFAPGRVKSYFVGLILALCGFLPFLGRHLSALFGVLNTIALHPEEGLAYFVRLKQILRRPVLGNSPRL